MLLLTHGQARVKVHGLGLDEVRGVVVLDEVVDLLLNLFLPLLEVLVPMLRTLVLETLSVSMNEGLAERLGGVGIDEGVGELETASGLGVFVRVVLVVLALDGVVSEVADGLLGELVHQLLQLLRVYLLLNSVSQVRRVRHPFLFGLLSQV